MALTKEYTMGMDLMAKTFAGLEEVLAQELHEIGAQDIQVVKRGVLFRGDLETLYKANYLLRTALRVLKPAGVFEVKDNVELYNKVKNIDWTKVFRIDQTFIVNANVFHSELTHSHFVALRTKDAIVDQFRDKTGKRPWVAKEDAHIYVDVHISHDRCSVSLDSSGNSLHRREYRISADKAPINEVLAAGMVKLTGWKGDKDFYDPMCGSGTIPIEAAMQAMNIPSGYYRKQFAFMKWADFDVELWEKVKQEADLNMGELDCEIYASDRSEKAIGIAKRNIKNAGLHKDINTNARYFDAIKPDKNNGILVFNPPYGKRLEERGDIIELYKKIGDTLKQQFAGFEAWIIAADFESPKFIGLKPSRKITLFNGPIEAKFLKYELYEGSMRGERRDSGDKRDYSQKGSFKRSDGGERRGGFKRSEGGERGGGFKRSEGDDRIGGFKRSEGDERRGGFKRSEGDERRGGFRRSEGDKRGGGFKRSEGDERRGGFKRSEGGEHRGGYKRSEGDERRGGYKRSEGDDRRGGFKRSGGDERKGGYKRSEGDERRGGFKRSEGDERRGGFRRSEGDKYGGGFKRSEGDERRGGYKRSEGDEGKGRFKRSEGGEGKGRFKKSEGSERKGRFKRSEGDESKGRFKKSEGRERKEGFKRKEGRQGKGRPKR